MLRSALQLLVSNDAGASVEGDQAAFHCSTNSQTCGTSSAIQGGGGTGSFSPLSSMHSVEASLVSVMEDVRKRLGL